MTQLPDIFLLGTQRRFRKARAELFRHWLQPAEEDRILDLGGGYGDYFAGVVPFRRNVWIADVDERVVQRASSHGFHTIVIPTDSALPFPDESFDIIHCNSVIEHVLVPEHRQRMAAEIRRVGRNWFVQTPNRYFPLDPHTCLPLLHLLPERWLRALVRCLGRVWGWSGLQWRLLDQRELSSLFPGGRLLRERFAGLTKSLVMVGGDRIMCPGDARVAAARSTPSPAHESR